jgi:hypothetical protein
MYAKARCQSMRTAAISFAALLLAGCAPTYAPHIDAPSIAAPPMLALKPQPNLPDIDKSLRSCPPGSGFVTCFTPAQEAVRQQRFKLLHDDRDYCRDAYAKAMQHDSQ